MKTITLHHKDIDGGLRLRWRGIAWYGICPSCETFDGMRWTLAGSCVCGACGITIGLSGGDDADH